MNEERVREIVREELNKNQEEDIIYVPDTIKIVKAGCGDGLGLCFGDGQVLIVNTNGSYGVSEECFFEEVKCKFIKVNKPKPGNLYFHTDSKNPDFSSHCLYCKKLEGDKYVFILEKDPKRSDCNWKYWYQVVEV